MNILIIGCGYVGQAIASFWQQQDHQLTLTTTTLAKISQLSPLGQVVIVEKDSLKALTNIIQNQEVVVFSVSPGRRGRDPVTYRQTYLETAKNLVSILQNASNVKQLIYTGSYAVLGNHNGEWVDEETPYIPVNERGQILAETEQVLLSAQSETLKVCILRLGGIYGLGREVEKIFGSWFGTTQRGTGEDYVNWVHLDDIVTALEFTRLHKLQGIYNLVNDVPIKKRELLDKLAQVHDLESVIWDKSDPGKLPYNTKVSNEKIKAAGFQFIYPQVV